MGSSRFEALQQQKARARQAGSGIFVRALSLRECLSNLTDALANAEHEDVVLLDVVNGQTSISPASHGSPAAPLARVHAVTRPDGLWEWRVRRDFVRAIRRDRRKDSDRLAATLGGPRSRQRFVLALADLGDAALVRAFDLHRRRQLRAWAGRVLRVALVL